MSTAAGLFPPPTEGAVATLAVVFDAVDRLPDDAIRAAYIERPAVGDPCSTYAFRLAGWVLGREQAVKWVEARCRGVVHAQLPVAGPRPDLVERHGDVPWAAECGFDAVLNGAKLPVAFDLDLLAVFADGSRSPVGTVRGRRSARAVDAGPDRLQPIMLTTLGRSGSTWVTRLLGQHPEIITYAPFRFEPRAASYWMEVYGALSHPRSYQQTLAGELYGPEWWVGSRRSEVGDPMDGTLEEWLGAAHSDALLSFGQERIEAFYREAARLEHKGPRVRFFCEKFTTNSFVQPLLGSLFPHAREIILVRDFRDMICSMLSYNLKRGSDGFGRGQVETDEDFIRWWQGGAEQLVAEWEARADDAILVRYEDLVSHPDDTLPRLLDGLGVDADSRCVAGMIQRATELTPRAQKLHSTTSGPAASIGRWRQDLAPDLQHTAAEVFDLSLRALGYDPEAGS